MQMPSLRLSRSLTTGGSTNWSGDLGLHGTRVIEERLKYSLERHWMLRRSLRGLHGWMAPRRRRRTRDCCYWTALLLSPLLGARLGRIWVPESSGTYYCWAKCLIFSVFSRYRGQAWLP